MTVENANPRVRRSEYESWVGKKVMIGTSDFHYLCGRITEIDADAIFTLDVGAEKVRLSSDHVATIQEAPAHQAEYVK